MGRIDLRGATALTVATTATLAAEVLWTAYRPLPHGGNHDASATVGAHRDGRPLRVVAVGDSTLTGPGLEHPGEVWLRQALELVDHPTPIELTSLAVGGSRAVDVARRLPDALDAEPDVVVVAVGSNDAIHATPLRQFLSHYDRTLAALSEVAPVAVTNLGDLGCIVRFPPPLRQAARRRGRSISAAIERTVARHANVTLLDVSPANPSFADRSLFGPDLFHPTATGHAMWAHSIAPQLAPVLAAAGSRCEVVAR